MWGLVRGRNRAKAPWPPPVILRSVEDQRNRFTPFILRSHALTPSRSTRTAGDTGDRGVDALDTLIHLIFEQFSIIVLVARSKTQGPHTPL